jgi:cell division protease FtsH
LEKGNIAEARIQGMTVYGEFKDPPEDPKGKTDSEGKLPRYNKEFETVLPSFVLQDQQLDKLLRDKLGANYAASEPSDNTGMLLAFYLVVTVGLVVAVWMMFRRTREQLLGGGVLAGFSKSPAKRYESGDSPITFDDVAGLQGVKHELEEVVEFLKNPQRFQRLGGRVPKGVLLMGPPGTGKTLLGRAVAGEAGVPFFSISGSEFIQMFVGVGASRVRDMFANAKAAAPAILFIDEIDAVGRHRGTGLGGGHDEREQTLNQILSEMDGFTQNESVIVMAATNRPDVLDPALLRPGRFDRHIAVDRPTYKGRLAIFKVHARNVPLADDIDFDRLAAGSVGLTGADIRNLVNEAALFATRNGKDAVDMSDFEHARDRVLMGAKREEVLVGKEKSMTAYHESGHALLGWLAEGAERVHKVTIIPRGRALGITQLLPEEDRVNISESELHARLVFVLGGRAAEKLVFDEYSAGAENDLRQATELARRMVTQWGMSERLGPVAFHVGDDHPFLGKEMAEPRHFSEHTAQVIDEEIVRILREAADKAEQSLRKHRDKLDLLASALEREETLEEHEIEMVIGPPAYKRPTPTAQQVAANPTLPAEEECHRQADD